MKAWTIAGTALVLMSGVGMAVAQQAPAAPPPPPANAQPGGPGMDGPGPRGPMGGPGGWRHHRMGEMPPPPFSKAAHFRLRKEGGMIDVKCAENETMKACVDAASALLDKAAAQK